MAPLSQSELLHRANMFVNNGVLPEPQSILIKIGYGPAGLNVGRGLIQQFASDNSKTPVTLAAQKQATQTQRQARRAAHIEMNNLKETSLLVLRDNPAALTSLGYSPRHHHGSAGKAAAAGSEAEPGSESSHPRAKTSTSLAEDLVDWNLALTNIPFLSEAEQAALENAGWGAERIAAAIALVEACATADIVQQQKIQAYLAQSTAAKAAEAALRKWYSQAARLSKLAIKQADPANQARLLELLGL